MKRRRATLSIDGAFLRKKFIVFVCVVVSICLLPVQGYAAASLMSGYKKTSELTDADRSDAYQKNYQQADKSTNASFLYKTAEWTNRAAKEAKITLTAQEPVQKEKRSAVYAFNVCEAHGFTKDIAKKNIDFLLKNFDQVDVIRTGLFGDETVYTMENIKSFDDINWPSQEAAAAAGAWSSERNHIVNSHGSVKLYDGLRKYLKNKGKDNEPTCIYVSFDMFYLAKLVCAFDRSQAQVPSSDEDSNTGISTIPGRELQDPEKLKNVALASGVPETMDEDCFDTLQRYKKEGRYFSMACNHFGAPITKDGGMYEIAGDPENFVKVKGKAEVLGRERFFYSANIIAALADPTVWPGREAAKKGFWNGETYNPANPNVSKLPIGEDFGQKAQSFKGVAPDYPYSKDFETMKVPAAHHSLYMTDTVADTFEIVEATSENPKVKVNLNGNTVSALWEDYGGSVPMTVTVRVKLKEQKEGSKGGTWVDTNKGSGKVQHLAGSKEIKNLTVASPKLFVEADKPEPPVRPEPPDPEPPAKPKPPKPEPPAQPEPPVRPEPPDPEPPAQPEPPKPEPPAQPEPPKPEPPTRPEPPDPEPPAKPKPPKPEPPAQPEPPKPEPPARPEPPTKPEPPDPEPPTKPEPPDPEPPAKPKPPKPEPPTRPEPPTKPEPPDPEPPAKPKPPVQPEPPKPVPPTRPEPPIKPEPPDPEPPAKPKPPKPEPPTKPEPSKPASPKPQPPKPQPPAKSEPPKSQAPKSESPKPTPAKPAPKRTSAKSKRLPGTEDTTNSWVWIGVGVLGAGGIVGALSMRRRNKE